MNEHDKGDSLLMKIRRIGRNITMRRVLIGASILLIAGMISGLTVYGLEQAKPDEQTVVVPTTTPEPSEPSKTPDQTPDEESSEMPEKPTPSATPTPGPTIPPGFKVTGYITHWRFNTLSNVDFNMVTHIIWQGLEVTSGQDPTLRVSNDADWKQIERLAELGHAHNIKVLISLVGHWDNPDLTDIWKSPTLRAELINNIKKLIENYDIDGIDLDNENYCDPAIYSQFIEELYKAINPQGTIISLAAHPYKVCINANAAECLDFVNLMTYDMGHGPGYPYHSTLEESITALNLWTHAGIPKNKLLMGIPFYGRDGHITPFEYWWIVNRYDPSPDQNEVDEPLAAGGVVWWNGIDLVKEKTEYVLDNHFGGVMVYELGNDCFDERSLLLAAFEELTEQYQSLDMTGSG